jgi:hypothetical protein
MRVADQHLVGMYANRDRSLTWYWTTARAKAVSNTLLKALVCNSKHNSVACYINYLGVSINCPHSWPHGPRVDTKRWTRSPSLEKAWESLLCNLCTRIGVKNRSVPEGTLKLRMTWRYAMSQLIRLHKKNAGPIMLSWSTYLILVHSRNRCILFYVNCLIPNYPISFFSHYTLIQG